MEAVYFFSIEDGEDVWMVERGGGAGLLLEPSHTFFIFSEGGRQKLQCHFAAELAVLGQIYLTPFRPSQAAR